MENDEISKKTSLEDLVIDKVIQLDKENLKKFIAGENNSISASVTFNKDDLIDFIKGKLKSNEEKCKLKVIQCGIKKGFITSDISGKLCVRNKNAAQSNFGQLLNEIILDKVSEFDSDRLEINCLLHTSSEENNTILSLDYVNNLTDFIEKHIINREEIDEYISALQTRVITAYKEADIYIKKLYGKFFTDLFFAEAFKKNIVLNYFHFSVKKYLKENKSYREKCFSYYMNSVKEKKISESVLDMVRSCFLESDYEDIIDVEETVSNEKIVYILTKLKCTLKRTDHDFCIEYKVDDTEKRHIISQNKLKNALKRINPDFQKDDNKMEEVFKDIMRKIL